MDCSDFGDIAIDVISVIREGHLDGLKSWLVDYDKSEGESKENKRKEVSYLFFGVFFLLLISKLFGESSWGSNMSGLLWAIDIEDKSVCSLFQSVSLIL
jgi:hypothetical protein